MGYRQEEKELAAIGLLEKIMDEQSELKVALATIGANFTATQLIGHMERLLAIIGTSGAPIENKSLRKALYELNLEIIDEFPHNETIEFLVHEVLNKFYDAVGEHFGSWEKAKKAIILHAYGAYSVIEPKLFGGLRKRNSEKKLSFNDDYEEDDFDDYD